MKPYIALNKNTVHGPRLFIYKYRDLKIGDEFTFPNGNTDIVDHFESVLPLGILVGKNPDNFVHLADRCMYEVIAPIDPELKWIKEGQEFEADELACCWSEQDEEDRYILLEEWKDFLMSQGYPYRVSEITVKCPTCKFFH